jgi:REP element-mobilizing transposase RayT
MKKIRLAREVYHQCSYPCQVAICSAEGSTVFTDANFAYDCMSLLESLCKKYDLFLSVYCFMPDHLHFVVSVRGEKSVIDLVGAFKSCATRDSRAFGFKEKIFQPRFHDHFIRTPVNFENSIMYILNNPVRKGLVKDYSEYPFCRRLLDDDD